MLELITLITAVAIVVLIAFEINHLNTRRHRAQTSRLLTYIAGLNRTIGQEANATGTRWQN